MNKNNRFDTKKSDKKIVTNDTFNSIINKSLELKDTTQARKIVNNYIENFTEFRKK